MIIHLRLLLSLLLLCVLCSCANTRHRPHYPPMPPKAVSNYHEVGMASYYSDDLHHGKTASGERYNKHAFTCSHRKLPFGTKLRVTNLSNNRSVIVTVNDRGPFNKKFLIDLSKAAAKKLDFVAKGITKVRVESVSYTKR